MANLTDMLYDGFIQDGFIQDSLLYILWYQQIIENIRIIFIL